MRVRPSPAPFAAVAFALGLVACGSSTRTRADAGVPAPQPDAATRHDGAGVGAGDGAADGRDAIADVDKAATCADAFGASLTNAFGRVDGTVLAIVPPGDEACADPNSTHLVIQVTIMGVAYRMVLDVLSDIGNPDVFFAEKDAPLAAGPWSEGWHPGVTLDYVTTLGIHSGAFTEMNEGDLVAKVTSEIALGAHVSVFATSDGEPSSAHLIHRNVTNQDGAIVVSPETAPHYLLFRFAEDSF